MTALACLAAQGRAAPRHAGEDALQRVALNGDGVAGNWNTVDCALSADGLWIVVSSYSSNLISRDGNEWANAGADIFVIDLTDWGGGFAVERASVRYGVHYDDGDANDCSYAPTIADGGRYVAFQSYASDLVPGDTNGAPDIFIRDRDTDADGNFTIDKMATWRASVASDGREADLGSFGPRIAIDGSAVWFSSSATNLVAGDTNGAIDLFRHDLVTRATTRVSLAWDGAEPDGDCTSARPTADGTQLLFLSSATNLVPGDTNGTYDLFVRDLVTGAVERVSVATGGAEGDGPSTAAGGISADGRFVLFGSYATNLVPGDTNGVPDCFLRDRQTGTTVRVSVASGGLEADGASFPGTLTDDGTRVVFSSSATNLDPRDGDAFTNVFVRDLASDATEVVFLARSGAPPDGDCHYASASPDLVKIGAICHATNLVSWDHNAAPDHAGEEPYVRDLGQPIGGASWRPYGDALWGKRKPSLVPRADPVLGTTVTFDLGNSAPYPTSGWLFGGGEATALKLHRATFANDLSLFLLPVTLGLGVTPYDADVTDDPAMTGISIFAQLAVLDSAAPVGLSLSRGIELVLGN
ncbi:MAG: hypothetical protein JNL90_14330 [Planctomycetes bacterium]|nr:hypothetical protein [Planctomycetota bacterium]